MAEKDEKKKPAEGGSPAPAGAKSKKKLLLFVGIGIAGIVAVALAVFFVFNPSKPGAGKDNTVAQAKEEGHGGGKEKEGGHGGKEGGKGGSLLTFALDPFILNLADIESNRYLKISITLEFDAPRTTQDAEQRIPQIRDAMILLMSSLTYGDIHSVAGKLTLQSEIQNRISKVVEPGSVKRVFFTDLVVQ
jgi:flagellar FliL protein